MIKKIFASLLFWEFIFCYVSTISIEWLWNSMMNHDLPMNLSWMLFIAFAILLALRKESQEHFFFSKKVVTNRQKNYINLMKISFILFGIGLIISGNLTKVNEDFHFLGMVKLLGTTYLLVSLSLYLTNFAITSYSYYILSSIFQILISTVAFFLLYHIYFGEKMEIRSVSEPLALLVVFLGLLVFFFNGITGLFDKKIKMQLLNEL